MASIRVWDLPLRLFHWALVLLVACSFITGEFSSKLGIWAAQWHEFSGYAVLALLLFRLSWGFIGGTHARFASFLRGPQAVIHYLGELTGNRPAQQRLGHNPLGGWSVIAMLLCLAFQAGSGLFISDEDLGLEGPLAKYIGSQTADWLKELHESNFVFLLLLIGMHLSAIAYYRFVKGENLVRPMITGSKHLPLHPEDAAAKGGHILLGVIVLTCSAGIVWYIANRL
jgi:cytochrome b